MKRSVSFSVIVALVLSLFVLARPAHAQEQTTMEKTADVASYGTVALNGTMTVLSILKSDHPTCEAKQAATAVGVAVLTSELVKHFVSKARPDGSDFKSMPSEHAAVSEALSGYSFYVGTSISFGTGGLRVGANRHDKTDVAAGLGIGYLSQQLGKLIFRCA